MYRIILETDPSTIAGRVAMRGADNEIPLAEQVNQYLSSTAQIPVKEPRIAQSVINVLCMCLNQTMFADQFHGAYCCCLKTRRACQNRRSVSPSVRFASLSL